MKPLLNRGFTHHTTRNFGLVNPTCPIVDALTGALRNASPCKGRSAGHRTRTHPARRGHPYRPPTLVIDPLIKPLFAHAADNGFPSDHAVAAMVAPLVMTYRKMLGAVLLAASILVQLVRTGRALGLGCPLGCQPAPGRFGYRDEI